MSEKHMGHPGAMNHGDMSIDEKAILTYEGWFSIHATYKINFEKWQSWDTERQIKALAEFKAFIAELEAGHQAETSSYALYNVAGGKGDIMIWFLQPTLEEVTAKEITLRKVII